MAAESPSPSDEALAAVDPTADHFAVLGLSRGYALDREALERRYLERSKLVHPDRFVGEAVGIQRAAMERSAAVNQAYRTLRDPVARAEYLVKLGGVDLDSSDPETGAPHPSQAFLIEMIELREGLAEGRGAALRDEVEARADDELDAAIAALDEGSIRAAAQRLVTLRYLQRFLEEVDAAEDG